MVFLLSCYDSKAFNYMHILLYEVVKLVSDEGYHVGKVAVVTGGGVGMGFCVSKYLVSRSLHVIIGKSCCYSHW